MTLLTAINQVCDVVSLSPFDNVYGSAEPNAMTMVALAQEAGDEIARRADWQKTLRQHRVAVASENLPDDFQRLTPGGSVRTAEKAFVRPVTNGGQWAVIAGMPSMQPYFFIRAGQVQFSPASAAQGAVIDYVSKNWVLHDPDGPQATFTYRAIQSRACLSRPAADFAAGDFSCPQGRPRHHGRHGIAAAGLGNGAAQLLPDPDGLQDPWGIAEERTGGRRRRHQERLQIQIWQQ